MRKNYYPVSIPYREAKNKLREVYSGEGTPVSIPYREAKNWTAELIIITGNLKFSIPYREDKNGIVVYQ